MTVRTFKAILHKEDDLYVAEWPEVGTVSQGHTIIEEARQPEGGDRTLPGGIPSSGGPSAIADHF